MNRQSGRDFVIVVVVRTYFKALKSPKLSFCAQRRISNFQEPEILHFVQDDKDLDFAIAASKFAIAASKKRHKAGAANPAAAGFSW